MTNGTQKLKTLKYTGHHNAGPLHLAADVAVIGTVAGTLGVVALVVVLVVIILAIALA